MWPLVASLFSLTIGEVVCRLRYVKISKRLTAPENILKAEKIEMSLNGTMRDITASAHQHVRELAEIAEKERVRLLFNLETIDGGGGEAIIHNNTIILPCMRLMDDVPIKGKVLHPASKAVFYHELGHLRTNHFIQHWSTDCISASLPLMFLMKRPQAFPIPYLCVFIPIMIVSNTLVARYKEKLADLYMVNALQSEPEEVTKFIAELEFGDKYGKAGLNYKHPPTTERVRYIRKALIKLIFKRTTQNKLNDRNRKN